MSDAQRAGRNGVAYYLLLYGGIIVMLAALVLSFVLTLPERPKFAVVGLTGITGWAISTLARRFRAIG